MLGPRPLKGRHLVMDLDQVLKGILLERHSLLVQELIECQLMSEICQLILEFLQDNFNTSDIARIKIKI